MQKACVIPGCYFKHVHIILNLRYNIALYITDIMETRMALRITQRIWLVIVIIAFMTTMVRTESGKYYDIMIPLYH